MKVLSLDIGGTKIASAIVDSESLLVRGVESTPTAASEGGDAVLARICAIVERRIADKKPNAIGIASAGIVGLDGSIISATDLMPGWKGQPLGPTIRERFSLPTGVLNDVHAHALGEALAGSGVGASRCLVAGIGTGIGGALVIDGVVDRGFQGIAGHIGHIQHPAATGYLCSCGRDGHIEPIASGTGILEYYRRNVPGGTCTSTKDIALAAAAGDADALRVLHATGVALGESLACLSNVLDPDRIVLAGSVVNAGQTWIDAVHEGFTNQAMDLVAPTPIVTGALPNAALLGAALLQS